VFAAPTPFDAIDIPAGTVGGSPTPPSGAVTRATAADGLDDGANSAGMSPIGGDTPVPLATPAAHPRNNDDPYDLEGFFTRLFSSNVPDSVRRKSKDEVYATLDAYGPGYFLEEIARGAIPVEIAFRYELPVLFFMRWLQDCADSADYDYALTLCADTLAAKSRAVLEIAPDNAAEGSMIREYAKRALDLAERIAPDGWSSSKKPKTDSVSHAPLQIAIVMPGAGQTIPGIELLSRSMDARPVGPDNG